MRRTDALKEVLEELSLVYNEGERMEVEFSNKPKVIDRKKVAISTDVKGYLGKDLEKPEELMVIIDSLSHEVEHIREGQSYSRKLEFAKEKSSPEAAITITKIIENSYIDYSRLSRFPGLRVARSFVIDSMMENSEKRPNIEELNKNSALLEGLTQISYAGYAKGIEDADKKIRDFLSKARPLINKGRKESDPEKRLKIISQIYSLFESYSEEIDEDDLLEDWENPLDDNIPDMDENEVGGESQEHDLPSEDQEKREEKEEQETENENGKEGEESQGNLPQEGKDSDLDDVEENSNLQDKIETESQKGASEISDGQEAEMPDLEDPLGSVNLEKELSEMEQMNEEGDSNEWYGVEGEEKIDKDFFEDRYEEIERREQENNRNIERRKDRREERSESTHFGEKRVKEEMENRGLDKEIEEAFREFKTRDVDTQAREGKKLDLDATVRHISGDYGEDRLYLKRKRAEVGDRAIGVALDLSGSMNELESKIGIASIAKAIEVIGDKLVASGFKRISSPTTPTVVGRGIITPLITAPGEVFEWEILDNINTGGKTPTAHGIKDVRELLEKETAREKTMIVVTDGKANVGLDSENPVEDARKEAKKTRQKGIKVIGLGVSSVEDIYMENIFGKKGYVRSDMDNLADNLIEVYRKQLDVNFIQ